MGPTDQAKKRPASRPPTVAGSQVETVVQEEIVPDSGIPDDDSDEVEVVW